MPIILIWNAAALPWERQFKRWLKELETYSARIGSWLGKRLAEAQKIDRATAEVPVFRFYNLALTARVSRAQFGALLTEPLPGLGHYFRNIGEAWRVDREIADRAREARLIGRLMDVLEQIATGVLASIDRFASPSAASFDPRRARASDLIGLLALGFNAVAAGHAGILDRAQRIHDALTPPAEEPTGTAPGLPAAAPAETAALPLAMRLDEGLRYIAAALLVIPAVSGLVIAMGRDLLLWIRWVVIDLFQGYERRVLDMRQSLLTSLYDGLRNAAQTAIGLFSMAQVYVTDMVRHWTRFGRAYIRGVTDGIIAFSRDFGRFWTGVHTMIRQVMAFTDAIMAIDLTQVIHQVLLTVQQAIEFIDTQYYSITDSPEEYEPPGSPIHVTLGELVLAEGGGLRARGELARAFTLLEAARAGGSQMGMAINLGVAGWFTDINLPGLIGGVRMLIPRLGAMPARAGVQPRLVYVQGNEPDLAAEIVEPMRGRLQGALTGIGTRVNEGIGGIVGATGTLMDGAADRFHGAARQAATLGNVPRWQAIVAQADAMTARAFPGGPAARPTGLEGIARTYGLWLQANFATLGAVTTGYLRFVLDEWRQHLDANADTPVEVDATSPRKLLQRAQLGRVHMERMTITVPARLTDRELAELVAARFRGAVEGAYAQGQARLAGLAG